MRRFLFILLPILLLTSLITACAPSPPQIATPTSANTNLANPASTYCTQQGHKLEMRKDEQGNVYGVCVFEDGSECDEWAFFRGECGMDKENKLSLNIVETAKLDETVQIDVLSLASGGKDMLFSVTDADDIRALVEPLDATLPLVPPMRCPPAYQLQFHLRNGDVVTFDMGICGLYGDQAYWQGMTIRPPESFASKFNELLEREGASQP